MFLYKPQYRTINIIKAKKSKHTIVVSCLGFKEWCLLWTNEFKHVAINIAIKNKGAVNSSCRFFLYHMSF